MLLIIVTTNLGFHCFVSSHLGVWLGNPYGRSRVDKIFIPDIKQQDVRAVEALNKEATKFALALLDVFFSKETLCRSLATRKEGRDLLNPDVVEGIRRKTSSVCACLRACICMIVYERCAHNIICKCMCTCVMGLSGWL